MADSDDRQASTQVWGAAVVVASALAVVAAYLINGAPLVLAVAGVEVLLLMVYVGRRWRALHQQPSPAGHRRRGIPDAAHCERCRRAREALDARQARGGGAPAARQARPEARPESAESTQESAESTREPEPKSAREAEPEAADRPPYPHRPQGRAPYERPWTAERAAARPVDRTAARRSAPGSAGRAVRHQ
ncbi:hypothetical protein [Streptomyces sp. FH025]|uniref:hypothetical protein n=1 Tax=Streptomyces sp. FH025 TaxID=2815937 RepID=UPI001A9D84A8|nr:hypothetical protein [Streptomyces sp. FH025]MBO1417186.1 hypothetical protein [Streptomyces sp. FH025]